MRDNEGVLIYEDKTFSEYAQRQTVIDRWNWNWKLARPTLTVESWIGSKPRLTSWRFSLSPNPSKGTRSFSWLVVFKKLNKKTNFNLFGSAADSRKLICIQPVPWHFIRRDFEHGEVRRRCWSHLTTLMIKLAWRSLKPARIHSYRAKVSLP